MRWETIMAAGGAGQPGPGEGGGETRQRLRPWLIDQLNRHSIPGLEWMDPNEMTFKIPWKHGGKQDWDPQQAQIFKAWATHTGKFRAGVDQPNYAKWKTNLRCALNKAPDIQEKPDMSRKDEPNPFKVYKFLEKRNKRGIVPINVPSDSQSQSEKSAAGAPVLPTFIKEYSSSGSYPSDQKPDLEPMFASTYGQSRPIEVPGDRLPSDLGTVDSGDLMHLSDGGPRLSDALGSEDQMDTDEGSTLDGPLINHSPDSQSSYDCTPHVSPYAQDALTTVEPPSHVIESKFTPPLFTVPEVPQSNSQLVYSQSNTFSSQLSNSVKPEPPALMPFDNSRPSHECVPKDSCDMYLEILYRNHLINSHHISSRTKGCRITNNTPCSLAGENVPDIFRDVLLGTNFNQRQTVELPNWPMGICSESLLPSIQDLLKNMQRGLILECKHGDIFATRLCKTTIYYSSGFTGTTQKLIRHDDSVTVTKIFDMENDFKTALTAYDSNQGERPNPYVYLYIGQNGSELDLGSLLIVIRLTSCRALQLLNDVDEQRCHQYSMHISESNEYDHLGDCVNQQLEQALQ